MSLRDVLGEDAFAIATAYGKTMHLQHDAHVLDFNCRNVTRLYDSALASTRVYWRKRLGANDEQAADPRPFAEVRLAELKAKTEP